MSHLATGSAFGRFVACEASSVLPRVWAATSEDAEAGRARHAYLERIAAGATPDDSMAEVPEEYRSTCADIDLEGLHDELQMVPEVTLAYHPGNDTARIVGQGLDRDYSDITFDELPMTLDLVDVDLPARRGRVKDYKSGWGANVPPADVNWQIKGGTLALARAYDLDEVDGELIFLGRGRRSRAVFTASDFLVAADDLRRTQDRALRNRERYARGEHIEPTEGPHCRYCPCAWSCPAKTALIRAALGAPMIGGPPVEPAEFGKLWTWVDHAQGAIEQLRKQMVERIRESPVPITTGDDGTVTYLAEVIEPGDERLAPDVALAAAAEVLAIEPDELSAFESEVTTKKITKTAIERAVKDRVPKGQWADYLRRVVLETRARGGASRPPTKRITTYTVRPTAGED